ncbi:MAG TPA: BTAD domain-containing putative transcriptional regulator [Beijerinckiaceae bacterium]|jgi:DNA-binding SARP family transcriptional activator
MQHGPTPTRRFRAGDPRPISSIASDAGHRSALALLDGFALTFDGRPVEIRSRKAQALLAYIAMDEGASASRERLCGLLWSETSEDKARASLRQTVHGLREDLDRAGCPLVEVDREALTFADGWTSDIAGLVARTRDRDADPRLLTRQRLPDALLPGFEDADPAFRLWLLVQRQSLAQELTWSLMRIVEDRDAPADRARDAARALVNLDPTNEEACRHLIEDAAARGDTAGALKLYKRLWDLLDEEYGTEPSSRTQALIVRIKTGEISSAVSDREASPVPSAAEVPASDHPYLVISTFDYAGVDSRYMHLVGGLRHELIARLVRFREWSVIDGSAAVDVATLPGRCFSVEATLRQAGPRLSLTVTTKQQPGGRFIWSESFVIDDERWFEIEPLLLRRIAMALNVQITTEQLRRNARDANVPLNLYESWLQGQRLILEFKPDAWDRAAALFRSVNAAAPHFSPAYSSLVQLHNIRHIVFPGTRRTEESIDEGLQLAAKAVQIDPFDSRAHLAHGWALSYKKRWAQAQQAKELALQLNENDPWTLTSAALVTAFNGRHEAAIDLAEQALRLMPQPPPVYWAYQATLRCVCGDYAGSADAAEQAEGAIANVPGWHAAALAHLGDRRAARQRADAFLAGMRQHWHAEDASDEAILSWFLDAFPIRVEADRDRLREGLTLALA